MAPPTDEDLGRGSLFARLTTAQRQRVAALTTTLSVPAGRVLMEEGAIGRELIVIVEGNAEIQRGGETVRTCGPGDFTGESALVADRPCTESVRALTDLRIEVIEGHEFRALAAHDPQLSTPVMQAVAARLEALVAEG